VCGFNGTALGSCGTSQPVARIKATQDYFKLSRVTTPVVPGALFSHAEITEYATRGRLTLFPDGQSLQICDDATILYVTEEFLGYVDDTIEAHTSEWLPLHREDITDGHAPKTSQGTRRHNIYVACLPEAALDLILDGWAIRLQKLAQRALLDFFGTRALDQEKCSEAERLADLALCAAKSKELRQKLYLDYGVAIKNSCKPEGLYNVFRYIISNEFPKWSQKSFYKQLVTHEFQLDQDAGRNAGKALPDFPDMPDAMIEFIQRGQERLRTETDMAKRREAAKQMCDNFARLCHLEPDQPDDIPCLACVLNSVNEPQELRSTKGVRWEPSQIPMDRHTLQAIGCAALTYTSKAFNFEHKTIHAVLFDKELQGLREDDLTPYENLTLSHLRKAE